MHPYVVEDMEISYSYDGKYIIDWLNIQYSVFIYGFDWPDLFSFSFSRAPVNSMKMNKHINNVTIKEWDLKSSGGSIIRNFWRQINPVECIVYEPDQLQNTKGTYNTLHVWQ